MALVQGRIEGENPFGLGKGLAFLSPVTAPTSANESWFRCTGLQRAMIVASLKPDAAGVYHQQFVVHLDPEVDGALWLRAAQIFLQQHGGLMARFQMREGELFTTRCGRPAPPGALVELTDALGSPATRLHDFLERDRTRPFPIFEDAPAWRSVLLSLGENERAWVWSHHHALCDNFVVPMTRGIYSCYDQLSAGAAVSSEPVAPDFYDYLRWRQTRDWTNARAAWCQRFQTGDRMTALPEVRGNLLPDHDSNRFAVEISPETDRALRELCQQSEITLNTIVAAAWGLWLARVQEEPRAIFGIMRGARKGTIPGAESIFGIFTNTLPIAVPIPDDISVLDWLRDVRRELIALRSLEQNSLGEIAQWTGLDLGPDGPPSVLNFLRMKTVDILHAHGLPENRARVSLRQSVDVPLFISAHESPRLSVEVLVRPELVSAATTRAAARGLSAALGAIAAAPNGRLGEIDLLSTYDRVLLEKAERGPRVDVSGTKAHALIEREIREQPDGIAAVQGQYALTFRKFGEQAGSVARAIRESRLTSDVVAVILPPGPQILCAMLGILRAGAAFFLLNPLSPRLERERMLRRLSIGLAITDETNALDTSAAVPRVLEFEEILRAGLTSADKLPAIEIDGHDLAYLVHTSGSTGEKKFVEIEHRSLLNTIHALVPMYEMRRGDRRISRATPGNDYFLTETLVCLSGGGTLIFPERPGVMTVSEFSQTLRNERITVSGIPASYWHEWVRAMNDESDVPPDLRLVISSMEKADPNLLAKWTRLTRGRVTWLNAYGPAETAIVSHIFRAGDETADSNNVPIGRLLPNMEAYILDRAQRKLPAGMTGEIAISGVGVARGYRGDDEVTRAKFVPNPHARSSEFSRLYLTGDYGYIDACGQFVFVGRRDEQVKIAGHRIELGEVETALQEYKEIRQTVVTAEGDGTETEIGRAHSAEWRVRSESDARLDGATSRPAFASGGFRHGRRDPGHADGQDRSARAFRSLPGASKIA